MQKGIEYGRPSAADIVLVFNDFMRIQDRNGTQQVLRKLLQQNVLNAVLHLEPSCPAMRNNETVRAC